MTSRITETAIDFLWGFLRGSRILRPMTAILTFCLCTAALSASFAQGDNSPHERQIGDIDPVTGQNLAEIDDLTRFADLFRKTTNVPLAFVHADIAWDSNWRPVLEELAERVHRRRLRLGVICIGDGKELRNEAWINQAVQRCRAILADPKIKADALIVQSWYQAPTKMLPETDPGALTYAAVQVLRMVR